MLRCMPPKTTPWNGYTAAQYRWPSRPRGWKYALAAGRRSSRAVAVAACSTTRSSQARPGSRISARSRSSRRSSTSSTRHQSRLSPTASVARARAGRAAGRGRRRAGRASRGPATRATTSTSRCRRRCPRSPTTATRARRRTTVARSSTYRLPPAQSGSLGSGSLGAPGVRRRGPAGRDVGVADPAQRELRPRARSRSAPPAGRARTARCRAPCTPPRAPGCRPAAAPARPAPASRRRPSGWTGSG